jgi:hypothetical protein
MTGKQHQITEAFIWDIGHMWGRFCYLLLDRLQIVTLLAAFGLIMWWRRLNLVLITSLLAFSAAYVLITLPGGGWKFPYPFMIPLSMLAGWCVVGIVSKIPYRKTRLVVDALTVVVLMPTNLLVVRAYTSTKGRGFGDSIDPVCSWIQANTAKNSVIVYERIFHGFQLCSKRSAFLHKSKYISGILGYDKKTFGGRYRLIDNLLGGKDVARNAAKICRTTKRPTYILLTRKELRGRGHISSTRKELKIRRYLRKFKITPKELQRYSDLFEVTPKELKRRRHLLKFYSKYPELFKVNVLFKTKNGKSAIVEINCSN